MSRAFNFSAGPATLPEPVLLQAREELLEWQSERASVMEISHRGSAFIACAERAEANLRKLMEVPDDYAVLFVQGGATLQFPLIPMNFAAAGQSADYVITGAWSKKAAAEAGPHCSVHIAADMKSSHYTCLPDPDEYQFSKQSAYVHIAGNETIHGTEFHQVPDTGAIPLIADLSSSILSRRIDLKQYGAVYGGAQKNIGPSGLALMIISPELLQRQGQNRAKIFTYREHAAQGSMLNTPPTFAWYLAGLVFEWMLKEGGVAEFERRNQAKAELLYTAIDGSGGFYRNPVRPEHRSRMNVPFMLPNADLDSLFLSESKAAGLLALKGHRDLGGMRASLYNAMPLAGAQALVDFMNDFAKRHG